MDDRALDDLRELARRDAELSLRADLLRALDEQVGELRSRAEAIDAFFAAYPEEEQRRREAQQAAAAELDRRRHELADAERALAEALEPEAHERAESALARARDHVAVAQSALARAADEAAELERDASSLPDMVPLLEEQARDVARETEHLPDVPTGLRALVEWASHAHAELFVAARQVDAQRERLIREANELATMLLGEPTYGSTVAQLAERVLPLAGE